MWHTMYGWPWATIWAAISALFSMVAVGVAIWALLRWKKQDELKVKQNFKNAIADYAYCLMKLPESLEFEYQRVEYKEKIKELDSKFRACDYAWFATEGLLENNLSVNFFWKQIFDNHEHYLCGSLCSDEIGRYCMGILAEKFVFK